MAAVVEKLLHVHVDDQSDSDDSSDESSICLVSSPEWCGIFLHVVDADNIVSSYAS